MATRFSGALPGGLRYEPSPKWVKAELDGETVVDSRRAMLVWEPEAVVPLYVFPHDDVALDRLQEGGGDLHERRGAALAKTWRLTRNGSASEPAAWSYDDPDLEGHIALAWSTADRWLEEDEEILAHPRDPFKRIDIRRSSREVVVELDGHRLAESRRPRLLFETLLPVRFYLPSDDVRMDLLEPSDTVTQCAYKGEATHWSARLDEELHEDVAWGYSEPLPDNDQIEGLVCFYNEQVEITVDGERLERPVTHWSR